jgi:hypothetical protein
MVGFPLCAGWRKSNLPVVEMEFRVSISKSMSAISIFMGIALRETSVLHLS